MNPLPEKESFQERGERTLGILLLTNQFHDLLEFLAVIG